MLKQITYSIKVYSKAIDLMSKLKLWQYFIIPIAISIVVFSGIFIASYTLKDNLGDFIAQIYPQNWWGKSTFQLLTNYISGAIIIVIGLISYKQIVMALSAPFMSPVSEKIENYLCNNSTSNLQNKSSFIAQLNRGVKLNIRNFFKELFISILIIISGFIMPVIGSIFSTVLLFLTQAYYAGFGNIDYTLERHLDYKKSILFVQQNRGLAIGNGIVFMLFLFIPVIGLIIVLPFSVTAASIATIENLDITPEKIKFNVTDTITHKSLKS